MALIIAMTLTCTALTACSDTKTVEKPSTTVVEVTDRDDGTKEVVEKDETNTFEITDKNGNVLTLVPVYNVDGKTIIAGYIEAIKSKDGKTDSEQAKKYLKNVIALEPDSEGNMVIKYDKKNNYIVMKAFSDKNGFIIALQDAVDIDKDKDTEEYFQVTSKLDANNNLFIKINGDAKGKPINVTVKEDTEKKIAQVVDSKGNKTDAKDTSKSENIKDITDKAKEEEKKKETTTKNEENKRPEPTTSKKEDTPTKPNEEPTTEPAVDYISIVLKKNGQVDSTGDNITVEGSAAEGGTEVKISGPGPYSKYYVTSETDSFLGQLEFDLSVGDDIEVKLNNVDISTMRKTALKFVNLDSTEEKENDSEGSGSGDLGNSGSSAVSSAPNVELSFTGSNSIKAKGSGKNGAIYSECKLAIKGHGSAEIDGGDNLSGICSTETMSIKNATLNITSRAKQGISCDKKVTVNSGATINIESKGDGIHCNRFVFDGVDNDGIEKTSAISIKSITQTDSADGIDADEEITIQGGKLDIVALTPAKYGLKVRKIEKGNPKGIFEISGGTIKASSYFNTKPRTVSQKTIYATATDKEGTTFTVGSVKSASGAKSFICTPADVDTVSKSNSTSKDVNWSDKLGSVIL